VNPSFPTGFVRSSCDMISKLAKMKVVSGMDEVAHLRDEQLPSSNKLWGHLVIDENVILYMGGVELDIHDATAPVSTISSSAVHLFSRLRLRVVILSERRGQEQRESWETEVLRRGCTQSRLTGC
jgi:hypothetical protein